MKKRRFPAMLPLCMAIAASSEALALGLGTASLESELGRPLKARIPVIQAEGLDSAQLLVNVLPVWDELSDSAIGGLDPRNISIVSELDEDGNGHIYLRSNTAIVEPFLNFILSVRWPMGHISREYTLLLELPSALAAVPRTHTRSTVGNISQKQQVPAALPASPPPRTSPTRPSSSKIDPSADAYTTRRGDSLWKIAAILRRSRGGSQNTLMEQIFALNPHAFIRSDRAMLKERVTLNIAPDALAGASATSSRPSTATSGGNTKASGGLDSQRGSTQVATADEPASGRSAELSQSLLEVGSQVAEVTGNIEAMTQRLNELQQRLQQLQIQYEQAKSAEVEAAPKEQRSGQTNSGQAPVESGLAPDSTGAASSPGVVSGVVSGSLPKGVDPLLADVQPATDSMAVSTTEDGVQVSPTLSAQGVNSQLQETAAAADEAVSAESASTYNAVGSVSSVLMRNSWILLGVVVASTVVALIVRRRRDQPTIQSSSAGPLGASYSPPANQRADLVIDNSLFEEEAVKPMNELGQSRAVPRTDNSDSDNDDFPEIDLANRRGVDGKSPVAPPATKTPSASSVEEKEPLSSLNSTEDVDSAAVLKSLSSRLAKVTESKEEVLRKLREKDAANSHDEIDLYNKPDGDFLQAAPEGTAADSGEDKASKAGEDEFAFDDSAFDELDLGSVAEDLDGSAAEEGDAAESLADKMSPEDWASFGEAHDKISEASGAAAAFIEIGDYDGAKNLLELAIEKDEENTALCLQLLDVYAHLGEREAFEALAFQLEFRGEDSETLAQVDIMRATLTRGGDRNSLSS